MLLHPSMDQPCIYTVPPCFPDRVSMDYYVHPWINHGWTCYPLAPLTEYPRMTKLLRPSVDQPWMDTVPPCSPDRMTKLLCPSVDQPWKDTVPPWINHGWTQYPLAPLTEYPRMTRLLRPFKIYIMSTTTFTDCDCVDHTNIIKKCRYS